MTISDLEKKDKNFSEDVFISKANSRLKKIYNAITLNEVNSVKHFMSDDLFSKIENMIDELKKENKTIVYDEVNISSSIDSINEDKNNFYIKFTFITKFLKYFMSSDTNEFESGDMDNREIINQSIVFFKKKDAKDLDVVSCFGCGANFNINANGICPHCGRVYDLYEFDYIIKDMEL